VNKYSSNQTELEDSFLIHNLVTDHVEIKNCIIHKDSLEYLLKLTRKVKFELCSVKGVKCIDSDIEF